MRVLGLKAAQVLFLTILIWFLHLSVKILKKVALLVKKTKSLSDVTPSLVLSPFACFRVKSGTSFVFDHVNLVFAFLCQESQESGTFRKKRPKVCLMSHHDSFYVHLRVLGLNAAQELFLTILIWFLH